MSLTSVKDALKPYGLDGKIQTFDELTATVEEAAQVLNTTPNQIAKAMAFQLKEFPIVIMMEGGAKVSNPKFKSIFGQKANMVKFNDLEDVIGHPAGGVCPFALKSGVKLYFDETLKKHQKVFAAAGTESAAIGLTIDELESCVQNFKWIDVTK